jgi:hypothetical protein
MSERISILQIKRYKLNSCTMKNCFLMLLGLLFGTVLHAQQWASYQISVRGDTINCIDQKKQKQGRWVIRIEQLRGEPGFEEEGEFVNDQKEGLWRKYNLSGDLIAIESYKWGFKDGKQQYFTMYGDLLREESWRAVNPENPYDTIDVPDLNNPMKYESKVIKHESSSIKHGTWKYYDPNSGMIVKTEKFLFGQPDKGFGNTAKPETGESKPIAKPKTISEWEKQNSGKKKVKVRDGRTGG